MNKKITGLVIAIVVSSIVLPVVSGAFVEGESEDIKDPPDDPTKEKKDKGDKTPPIIVIENFPVGDNTDGNPGNWDVFAYDDESGINYETIKVYIDDQLIGTSFGIYNIPSTLGDHTILLEVMNDNPKNPLLGSGSNTVTIIDDDIAPPELSDLLIEIEFEFVKISLTARDYSGIDQFKILINAEPILPLNIEQNENTFTFVLKNEWCFEYSILNIEIEAIDGDNDSEGDALSSSICCTFELSMEAMYLFVIWKIEGIKSYINSNIESKFKHCLINKLGLAQNSLKEAWYFFEIGKITRSLFYNLKARFFLCITETLLKKNNKISGSELNFILAELHNIRNWIVFLMGASLGNEIGYSIADVEITLLNLIDNIGDDINGRSLKCLQNRISSASFMLDRAIIFLSSRKNPCHLIDCTQSQLQRVIANVDNLLTKRIISQDLGNHIKEILTKAIEDIELIIGFF